MSHLDGFLDKQVLLELIGRIKFTGILIDYGLDILVLYDGNQFVYIPLMQLQNIKINPQYDPKLTNPTERPMDVQEEKISYRNTLSNARGTYVKIFVTGNQILHGYVTSVLTNYFVFYSPAYRTMFISLQHLKWLIPYHANKTPYSLKTQHLPMNPSHISLPRTLEEQIKKLEGNMVVFDIADHPGKIGLLNKYEDNMIELITGDGDTVVWSVRHIKSIHLP